MSAGISNLLHTARPSTPFRHQPFSSVMIFYEVNYLPENDRLRSTIHPEARKEILKRLLELNHKIHEEESREENQVRGCSGRAGGGVWLVWGEAIK